VLTWERYRQDGYEAQLGLFLGEPLYHISRREDGRWQVHFRGEALADNKPHRGGQHYQQMSRLKDAAEAHFAQTFLPQLLKVLRSE
jgi:hypothetical protein